MVKPFQYLACIIIFMVVAYIGSIFWRVSIAEHYYLGRSELLRLTLNRARFVKPAVQDSYGSGTFQIVRSGKRITVWRQKINGFQHVYGSALASYELGNDSADKLFCANEWMEAFFDFDRITRRDFNDRRKDLYHNRIGRQIGQDAHRLGLQGQAAEKYMIQTILNAFEKGKPVILHYRDPKIQNLPTEAELGCPNLPSKGPFFGIFG